MYTPQTTDFWVSRKPSDKHKDWHYNGSWIDGYEQSAAHPHRELVMDAVDNLMPVESLLEIGCSAGPNLSQLHKRFPKLRLVGIDPNEPSVEAAHKFVPEAGVIVGDARSIPFEMKSFDVVLADASLMYITPEEIAAVMDSIALIAKKGVVIVERYSKSKTGTVCGGVWGRDYETLLKERGFKVRKVKIEPRDWPGSPNWAKFGYVFIGVK